MPCRATVTPLSVSLDRNKVTMPATEVGRTSQTSVRLSNQSSTHAYTFQFAVPASSRIKVSPNVGRLAPGSVTRVEVAYTPREEDFEDVKGSGVMHPGSGKENEGERGALCRSDSYVPFPALRPVALETVPVKLAVCTSNSQPACRIHSLHWHGPSMRPSCCAHSAGGVEKFCVHSCFLKAF